MGLTNFDNWRDTVNEQQAAPADPNAALKAIRQGVSGLDQTLLKKAIPFINSMAGMDQKAKVKLIAHVMSQVGLTPTDFSQIKTKMA
jgi:hypothetical protein